MSRKRPHATPVRDRFDADIATIRATYDAAIAPHVAVRESARAADPTDPNMVARWDIFDAAIAPHVAIYYAAVAERAAMA